MTDSGAVARDVLRSAGARVITAGTAMLLLVGIPLVVRQAHASCNAIPGTVQAFRSTLATVDRPFAGPGDFVTLRHDPDCHTAATGFTTPAGANIVTIIFRPPVAGPRNVVVLAEDCGAIEPSRAACAARADVATATCVPVGTVTAPIGLERLDADTLRFRFPDTDALVGAETDHLTLAGPAAIAVSAVGAALPCALASANCAAVIGLAACVDDLYDTTGTCATTPHPTFPAFTALPPSNNYQGICTTPDPPCQGVVNEIRFTTDVAGNVLLPIDWRGVLVNRNAVPVARLLRGSSNVRSFTTGQDPIVIPGQEFLSSYSPEGGKLPPIFEPQADPTAVGEVTLFGSADAPETVLRIARRSPTLQSCAGGTNAGLPCTTAGDCPSGTCGQATCAAGTNAGVPCGADTDCPGGECGPSLFDFGDRFLDGVGPVLVRLGACLGGSTPLLPCSSDAQCSGGQCGSFDLHALDPVPLDGLNQTSEAFAFVVNEAITNQDFNGDGDMTDDVVELIDRVTGVMEPIGAAGARGRAAVRVRQPPFSFPAVAVEADVVAFLEPEPLQFGLDANGDGDTFDTILRVFRLGPGGATDVTAGQNLVADGAPLVNGRSVIVSNGLVYFRTREAAAARMTTTRESIVNPAALSADGRFLLFGGGTLQDRLLGTTEETTLTYDGAMLTGSRYARDVSDGGRYVVFYSADSNVVQGDNNGTYDVFLRDRLAGTTVRVSVDSAGVEGNDLSVDAAISSDGQWIAFTSKATNLVSGDTNGIEDVFVRSSAGGTTERVSVSSVGAEAQQLPAYAGLDLRNQGIDISADGRFVVFSSIAFNLVPGTPDDPFLYDVFVRNRLTNETSQVNTAPDDTPSDLQGIKPTTSADGRYIAFEGPGANLVPGDTNEVPDIFVKDRVGGGVTRVSTASDGTQGNGVSVEPRISANGRFVTFGSVASNLVAGDTNTCSGQSAPGMCEDTFAHDLTTGITERVSVGASGQQANNQSIGAPVVSDDGATFGFTSQATNLALPPLSGGFVRAPDPLDLSADLSGDGSIGETVLQEFDVTAGTRTTVGPAEQVVVVGTAVAFLRPESAGFGAGCSTGCDLNGDGDTTDDVVQLLVPGGAVQSLGCAAHNLALSDQWVAALISERDQGVGGTDLNGDGDARDLVPAVHRLGDGPGSCSSPTWRFLGRGADAVDIADGTIVFAVPEASEGPTGTDLNADGDVADRAIYVHRAADNQTINLGFAVEDFVVAGSLLAFRTAEAAQGHQVLNGDGDALDDVLYVYDPVTNLLFNTGQAVTPCRLEACDPRTPYRVQNDTVTFLTFEVRQNADLNGDGDVADLVLQTFNVRIAALAGVGTSPAGAGRTRQPGARLGGGAMPASTLTTIAAVSAGICTSTGAACGADGECGAGVCYVPPGGCAKNLGVGCNPALAGSCSGGAICEPLLGGGGTCVAIFGECADTSACQAIVPGAICRDANAGFQRLSGPLAPQNAGAKVFTSAGACVERFAVGCTAQPCEAGQFCGNDEQCRKQHGSCETNAECPTGSTCIQSLAVAAADDVDTDEIPDPFDNCPRVPNVLQEDRDHDQVGDACDLCGNSVVDAGEECDDGNTTPGDCCSPSCTFESSLTSCASDGNPCTDDRCNGSGACTNTPNTVTCTDGNACTQTDSCQSGVCTGSDPVICTARDQCHDAGTCDPQSGICSTPPKVDGAVCDDGNVCTTGDVCSAGACGGGSPLGCAICQRCDPGLGCVSNIRSDCTVSQEGARDSSLLLRDRSPDDLDEIVWRLGAGYLGSIVEFGHPDVSDDYRLCVFDQSALAQPLLALDAPAGGVCRSKPCWSRRTSSIVYRDPDLTPGGIFRADLRSSGTGKTRVIVRARGTNFSLPALPIIPIVTVQFENRATAACWQSTLPYVKRQTMVVQQIVGP